MIRSGKPFAANCCDLVELPVKFLIVLLFMASRLLVEGQTLQTLCSFNNTNGAAPYAGLTLGNDGNFYGTTVGGGIINTLSPNGMGTVFKVTTSGTLTTLYSFTNGSDGANPQAALTLENDGNFYGTTTSGGTNGGGTLFQVTTNGTMTMLYSFTSLPDSPTGATPLAALTLGNDGNFYGTTYAGGSYGVGTIFQVTTNGTLTTLVSFNGINGAYSFAALALGNDGNFYGTTTQYGSGRDGTVFQVTTNGTLTKLASFNPINGVYPYAGLVLGTDGNFYGTTTSGGTNGDGTIFQVTTNGTLTTLVSFNGTNGAFPEDALTLGNDGNFYGTTYEGGSYGGGTIFQVTTNGTLTTLTSFNYGSEPAAGLTLGDDGNFYGTTTGVWGSGYGTVFRLLLPSLARPTLTLQFLAGCPQLNLFGALSNNFVVQYCTNFTGIP